MRNLGLALQGGEFGRGQGAATFLLSHAHWDHIQGFPFFVPFYTPGNRFTIYGAADSPAALEAVLEGQMAAQYFPVQSIKNMNAAIEMRLAPIERAASRSARRGCARGANPHGSTTALAFRIEDGDRVLVLRRRRRLRPRGPVGRGAGAVRRGRPADPRRHLHPRGPGQPPGPRPVVPGRRAGRRRSAPGSSAWPCSTTTRTTATTTSIS